MLGISSVCSSDHWLSLDECRSLEKVLEFPTFGTNRESQPDLPLFHCFLQYQLTGNQPSFALVLGKTCAKPAQTKTSILAGGSQSRLMLNNRPEKHFYQYICKYMAPVPTVFLKIARPKNSFRLRKFKMEAD